jgi:hypothetical protein
MPNIYWERQRGDNCRIHSINSFFGKEVITEQKFYEFCDEYDEIIPGLKSRNMDGFAEGRCIISYILSKIGKAHTILIPANKYTGVRDHLDVTRYESMIKDLKITSYFEFNPNHVWLNKYIPEERSWFKIDSLSGFNRIDPRIINNKNGIILVINQKPTLGNELIYYIKNLTGSKTKDELILYNLYHAINLFIYLDPKTNQKYLNLMKIFLEDYVKEQRSILSINNQK